MYQNTISNPAASIDPQFTDQRTLEATRGTLNQGQGAVPETTASHAYDVQQYGIQQPQQQYGVQQPQQLGTQQYGVQQPQQQYGVQQPQQYGSHAQASDPRALEQTTAIQQPMADAQQPGVQGAHLQSSIGVDESTGSMAYQARQPLQQRFTQQPIQQDFARLPIQQGIAQQPQQGIAQQPQQGIAQQPQQGVAQQPTTGSQGVTRPIYGFEQGVVGQPTQGVGSEWLSTWRSGLSDVSVGYGVDDRSMLAPRQAALGAFRASLPAATVGQSVDPSVQQSLQQPIGQQFQQPVGQQFQQPVGQQFQQPVGQVRQWTQTPGFAAGASKIPLQEVGSDLPIQRIEWTSPSTQPSQYVGTAGVQFPLSTTVAGQQASTTRTPGLDEFVTLQDGSVTTVGSLLSQASMDPSLASQQFPATSQQYGVSAAIGRGVPADAQSVRYGALPVAY